MALPGQISAVDTNPDDEGCYHEGCECRPTHKLCTEADSMGEEYAYYCAEHIEVVRKEIEEAEPLIDTCDWCGAPDVELRPFRDWEEGLNGPVSDVCGICRGKSVDRANEELGTLDDQADDFPDDYDHEPWTEQDQKDWEEQERARERDEDLQNTMVAYAEGNLMNRVAFDDPNFKGQRPPFAVGGIRPTGGKNDLLTFTGCVGHIKVDVILELKSGELNIAHKTAGYYYDVEVASSIIDQLARLGYPVKRARYAGASEDE